MSCILLATWFIISGDTRYPHTWPFPNFDSQNLTLAIGSLEHFTFEEISDISKNTFLIHYTREKCSFQQDFGHFLSDNRDQVLVLLQSGIPFIFPRSETWIKVWFEEEVFNLNNSESSASSKYEYVVRKQDRNNVTWQDAKTCFVKFEVSILPIL